VAEIIIMPKLGFNMSEGKLIKWYKQEGDFLKKGEPLFCIETDKTNIDIEGTGDGIVLRLLITEGDTVPVTTPICVVGDSNEDVDMILTQGKVQTPRSQEERAIPDPVQAGGQPERGFVSPELRDKGKIKITPRAKRVALEMKIPVEEWSNISGTGFQAGICEKDLLAYAKTRDKKAKASPLAKKIASENDLDIRGIYGSGAAGKIMAEDVRNALTKEGAAQGLNREDTEDGRVIRESLPYAGIRRIIGERLSMSASTAPHVYFTQKVNMEKLLNARKQVNEASSVKVSVTDFIVRAVTMALEKYPGVNASLDGDTILQFESVNVGVAVAAPGGLIVPNIKNAEKMSLVEIAEASALLIDKAREGKLLPSEYAGGTFTISNLGMFGIDNFTAIINPPEAAILAISATKEEPIVVVDQEGKKDIQIKPMMNIQLSADHRIIDGLLAAQFTAEMKVLLENPMGLLI
jgi:pyruvate dehydrogenase E2 component (dihydrolipoamide acetyltransferase)